MGHAPTDQDLPGPGLAAEASGEVEGPTAISALDGDRLAGVEPDADRERKLRLVQGLLDQPLLEIHDGQHRLSGR